MKHFPKFITITQRVNKLYQLKAHPVCEKYSITQAEFDILAFLRNNPEFDTAKDICDIRMLKKSIVSQSIDKLVKKNYIEKSYDKNDRRLLHLHIMPEAEPCVFEIVSSQKDFYEELLSCLSIEQRAEFFTSLESLGKNIDDIYNKEILGR